MMNVDKGKSRRDQVPLHIRWMMRSDMPSVMKIEGSYEHPWSESNFVKCLRQRAVIGMVAEHVGDVVGFMVYELHKPKLEILNLAVHPRWRRLGVGLRMVDKLKSKLSSHRRNRIGVDVRETNLAAQLFFRSLGFLAVRVKRKEYCDSGEDAFEMVFDVDG